MTTVDARGLRCPVPVIRLAAAARDAVPGSLVTVLATDPAAQYDVPAWARMRGHTVVAAVRTDADDTGDDPGAGPCWTLTVRIEPPA